jgi:hypothetical protein
MTRAIAAAALLFLTAVAVGAQDRPAPSSPIVVATPQWSRAIAMPDGRTFVTDGAMMIDAAIAKPAKMPTSTMPVASGKIMEDQMKTAHLDEVALGSLRAGTRPNTFVGPRDIPLNGNYVTFLRRVAPQSRLRFKKPLEGVVIVLGERTIGMMMPLAMPK